MEDRKNQCDGGQGSLAAGEECQTLKPFPRRPRDDIYPGVGQVVGVRQFQAGGAAVEEPGEVLLKGRGDGLKGLPEGLLHHPVQFSDDLPEPGRRGLQVGDLFGEEAVALLHLCVLLACSGVDGPQSPQAGLQPSDLLLQPLWQRLHDGERRDQRLQGEGLLQSKLLPDLQVHQAQVLLDALLKARQAILGAGDLQAGVGEELLGLSDSGCGLAFLGFGLPALLGQPVQFLFCGADAGAGFGQRGLRFCRLLL